MNTQIRDLIRTIPHYPKHGIMFRDVTTLLKDRNGFKATIDAFTERYRNARIDKVAGIEARGFIVGSALAYQLGAGFVPLRKKGKLPGEHIGHDYALEYGTDRIEVHIDAVNKGERVLLVDDLIATGGTAIAGLRLLSLLGAEIVECAFIVDLPELGGAKKLVAEGQKVFSLVEFDGE